MANYYTEKTKKKVQLIDIKYGRSPMNPFFESEYACLGTVTGLYSETRVKVLWDNGQQNDYAMKDLQVINERQYKSIW